MKLVIAGSRSITNYAILRTAIIESGLWDEHGKAIEVVSGKAPGVDTLGEKFAEKAGLKVHDRPADWDNITASGAVIRYNKRGAYNSVAGHWRNEEMAQEADKALVVWDGKSTGSLDMVHRMVALGKPVYLYPLRIGADTLARLEELGVKIIFPNSLTEGS
jgi:predicted Rossmann fold nucleotide-binding protein DprA/Smf involved in DNA uptake